MTNNVYKGVQAWMQALLEASQSNTLGNWWNARTLECVMLGTELSVAGKLEVYKDGLDFTKALFQAAKDGLLTQSDVDYNVNKLLMINWKFQNHFFHLEEKSVDELPVGYYTVTAGEDNLPEDIITFAASVEDKELEEKLGIVELIKDVEVDIDAPLPEEEQQAVVAKPKGGRPKKVTK